MKRKQGWIIALFVTGLLLFTGAQDVFACPGRVFNPITDVDWMGPFRSRSAG